VLETVGAQPVKYFIAEADGQKLGYLFVAGGFEPAH
jgi:hypothetical protein